MASTTSAEEYFDETAELQNQIGSEIVHLLREQNIAWDQSRLHVENHGDQHYTFTLMYRENDSKIAGIVTSDQLDALAEKYIAVTSEAANDEVKRLRFHLNADLKFNVEMWYTPTEGLPGWMWEEENEE